MFNAFFFENRAVYEIMRRSIAETHRLQTTIRCMVIACCIQKATNTHSEYTIYLLTAICTNYYYCIAAIVAQTLLNVTL
jgi:hypothetical protein